MTSAPLFSVVIPTFNRAMLLRRAIRSVLAQTFTDYEIVIADDASTDGTAAVVSEFPGATISYARCAVNGGNASARNLGVSRARGRFVAFLDSDDVFLPDFLLETSKIVARSPQSLGFTWCGVRRVTEHSDGSTTESAGSWCPRFASREEAYLEFLRYRRIGTGTGLAVRRSCFAVVGEFDTRLRKAVDTEFLIRLSRAYDFQVIPRVLIVNYLHGGVQVRSNHRNGALAYQLIIAKNCEALGRHPDVAATLYYATARQFYHAGMKSEARQMLLESVRRHPLQPKAWALAALFESMGARASDIHARVSQLRKRLF